MKKVTGLNLIPKTSESARIINEAIENSDLYAEYNSNIGFFFFPEQEETYDVLEAEIDNLLAALDVQYRIEGIF
jgi:hypothetical protein